MEETELMFLEKEKEILNTEISRLSEILDDLNEKYYSYEAYKLLDNECKQLLIQNDNLKKIIGILKEKIEKIDFKIQDNEEDYMKGLLDGIKEAEKMANVCPFCKNHVIESLHHIIPRKVGGGDNIENLIFLCQHCHDEVEMMTDEILKKEMFDSRAIRDFIINDCFPIIR